MDAPDVILVGAGLNGLVCAIVLARSGLNVHVYEERPAPGGVIRTEFPFAKAPRLAATPGAHRVGFVHQELLRHLRIETGLVPRDPSLFVPTTQRGHYLLAGAGVEGLREAAARVSAADGRALDAMARELDAFLTDLGSAWLAGPLSVDDTADRYVRPELREAFVGLCRGSLADYVARFGVQTSLVKTVLAADTLVGSWASWTTPGSAAPLLVRHAARSRAGGGDPVAASGFGPLVRALVDAAQASRAKIVTGVGVREVIVEGNTAEGVVLTDGRTVRCTTIIVGADPSRLRALVSTASLPTPYTRKIDGLARPGGIAKVNVALSALPRFACMDHDAREHTAVTYLVPGVENDGVATIARAFDEAARAAIPTASPLECVFTSSADDSMHHASIMVPWAPYDLEGSTWAAQEDRLASDVLDILESFAPGTRASVVDVQVLSPKKLEQHFGVTRGHLRHADDTLLFADRMPYVTPIAGLYACGQSCAPAGGVFGVAGHNAALRVLADFELGLERTEVGPNHD